MNRPLIQIETAHRNCDICGQEPDSPLFELKRIARCSEADFSWCIKVHVCRQCGFSFVSPAPSKKALEQYYGQAFAQYDGAKPDYSINKRIRLIWRHLGSLAQWPFVEIGSNKSSDFHDTLSGIFPIIHTVELNEHCETKSRSTRSMESGSAGVVAAYFVLEHVPDPVYFLRDCRRLLRSDGIIIIEVPYLGFYPADVTALGNYEHTNHFSAISLANAGRQAGLQLKEITHLDCSRPFGMAAVFSPVDVILAPSIIDTEIQDAISLVSAGAEKLSAFYLKIAELRDLILFEISKNRSVVVWAANEYSMILLEGEKLHQRVLVVDSDPAKCDYFSTQRVYLPLERIEEIRSCSLLVICAHLHIESILSWITTNVGRTFGSDEIICLKPPVIPPPS